MKGISNMNDTELIADLRAKLAAAEKERDNARDTAKFMCDAHNAQSAAAQKERDEAKAGMVRFSKSFEKVEHENSNLETLLATAQARVAELEAGNSMLRNSEQSQITFIDELKQQLAQSQRDLSAATAAGEKDKERLYGLWLDTTKELLTCRTALKALRVEIEPMARQIIHPKDNVMNRMIASIDEALAATYLATDDGQPSAARAGGGK